MKKLIVLLGPTGVGKTNLSLSLAEHYNIPIISTDSRQLYKGLEIGTAAPTQTEQDRVKHYMIGTLNVDDYYNASEYEHDALTVIESLFNVHNVLIACGGSMMYIDALCNGIDKMPDIDPVLRDEIKQLYEEGGLEGVQAQLKILDPDFYEEVDLKNPKRVMHALEVCLMTGIPYSTFRKNSKKERPFEIIKIGITRNRDELYRRINRRVDLMIEEGLITEARKMHQYRYLNALNTVGYKEMFRYLSGEWELDEAISSMKQSTRNYARKQLSWFRRDKDINWINLSEETEQEALQKILSIVG